MKICHVSLGVINADEPQEWLKTVPYFTRILTAMSDTHQVISFHYATVTTSVEYERSKYFFLKRTLRQEIFCSMLNANVREANPDVIVLHGFHATWEAYVFTSQMKNFPIYIQHHGEKLFRWPKAVLHKATDRFIKGYFFASREMARVWADAGLIADLEKVHQVFEVTSSFAANSARDDRHGLRFIWVGRLDENKDPLTLVDGFITFLRSQPNATLFLIFKTNDLLDAVKKRIAGFETKIFLVGHVPHNEMSSWYRKADFIISTSLYEVGAVAVLEAMSLGCIPILTDIPAFEKISGSKKIGLVFPVRSSSMLAETLVRASMLKVSEEKKKVQEYFERNLSASAIASQITAVVNGRDRKEKSSVVQ